jgi:hypothetical protein
VVQRLNWARGKASQDAIAAAGNAQRSCEEEYGLQNHDGSDDAQWCNEAEYDDWNHDQNISGNGDGRECGYSLALEARGSAANAAEWPEADLTTAGRSDYWRDSETGTVPAASSCSRAVVPRTAVGPNAWNAVAPADGLAERGAALCGEPGRGISRWAKYGPPEEDHFLGFAPDENEPPGRLAPHLPVSHASFVPPSHVSHPPVTHTSCPPTLHAPHPPAPQAFGPLSERASSTDRQRPAQPATSLEWSVRPLHAAARRLEPQSTAWLPSIVGGGNRCGVSGTSAQGSAGWEIAGSAQGRVCVGHLRGGQSNTPHGGRTDRTYLGEKDGGLGAAAPRMFGHAKQPRQGHYS